MLTHSLQFTNFLVALITPVLLASSAYGAYFLFGGLVMASVVVFALYMPETRGRSLESIQGEFRRPSVRSQLSSLLQPLGLRRRAIPTPSAGGIGDGSVSSDEPIEMELRDRYAAAASAVSMDNVARGLRLELGMA